eukprot:6704914-Prymnesium_polylepis.1
MEEREVVEIGKLVTPSPDLPAASVALALHSSISTGIKGDHKDLMVRQAAFGCNQLEQERPKWYLEFAWEALQDLTVILLIVMSAISLFVEMTWGHDKSTGWLDGVAIFVSVMIVVNVTASIDYSKQH